MKIQYSKTWKLAKVVFRGETYATNIYIIKNNFSYPNLLSEDTGKRKQTKLKSSKKKEKK